MTASDLSYEQLRAIVDSSTPSDPLYQDAQRELNRRLTKMVDNIPMGPRHEWIVDVSDAASQSTQGGKDG